MYIRPAENPGLKGHIYPWHFPIFTQNWMEVLLQFLPKIKFLGEKSVSFL